MSANSTRAEGAQRAEWLVEERLAEAYGFVPNLFRDQCGLRRLVEAQEHLVHSILVQERALKREVKAQLLHLVARAAGNTYCQALHPSISNISPETSPLAQFADKLTTYGAWISKKDIENLVGAGLEDSAILDVILTVALGRLLSTLSGGIRPKLDSGLRSSSPGELPVPSEPPQYLPTPGPYLAHQAPSALEARLSSFFREHFGFIPKLFHSQGLLPEVLEAEIQNIEGILLPEDHLSRIQKENIVLVISAANANTYSVALQTQILATLGISEEESDQVARDFRQSQMSASDQALYEQMRALACGIPESAEAFEPARLRAHGFTPIHITEAIATAAWANFLNTVQFGLGTPPDFPPRYVYAAKDLYRSTTPARLTSDGVDSLDPDGPLVSKVQNGDTEAFEQLVRGHTRRIFGTLAGIVGDLEDARDATQEVFLKAFEHIGRFEGRAKFSTWLTSIAVNTGTELLRRRKPEAVLDDIQEEDTFRPRLVQAWTENPEQMCATSQLNELVREAILRLPEKYRIAVMLREISQISTEEAAAALGLSVPALKARVLRGRLMLRERLAPHFIREEDTDA